MHRTRDLRLPSLCCILAVLGKRIKLFNPSRSPERTRGFGGPLPGRGEAAERQGYSKCVATRQRSGVEWLFLNAVEVTLAAQKQLVADDHGGSVHSFVELICGQDFQVGAVLQHESGSVAIDVVNPAAGGHR
jgi:hypothetical protein